MLPALRSFVIERAPCADGEHHTSYLLLAADAPGHVCVLPEANFRLTSAAYQTTVRAILAERGLILDFPEAGE